MFAIFFVTNFRPLNVLNLFITIINKFFKLSFSLAVGVMDSPLSP